MFGSEARSERIESGAPAKGEISQRWEDGECCQWNAKGQCTQGDACIFRHDEKKRGKVMQPSSFAPKPQSQSDGKFVSWKVSQRPESETVQRLQQWRNARLLHVIHGILQCVRITKPNRAANSVNKVLFYAQRGWQSAKQTTEKEWW